MLEKYDASHRTHRVSDIFGRTLRADMEAFASGERMSDALRQQLQAYQGCVIDDTVGETPHRDVSYQISRARAATMPYIGAVYRFQQNLEEWDAKPLSHSSNSAVRDSLWGQWKQIRTVNPSSYMVGSGRGLSRNI